MTVLTLAQPSIAAALTVVDPAEQMAECEHPGCGQLHWPDEGALVCYASGQDRQVCAKHAAADDPGASVIPGEALAEQWAQDEQTSRYDYAKNGA